MSRETCRPGQVALDLVLVFVAGVVVLGGLIALEGPRMQVYPPPASSERVQSYLVGGFALAAGIGILAFVVLRGGRRGWRSLRRLTGVLATGVMFPALMGAFNAAYFGANAIALSTLGIGVVFVAVGSMLLRRS